MGGCNSAILSQSLEHLEGLGIIGKSTDSSANTKLAHSIYRLTTAGRELQSVMDAINAWGLNHLPQNSHNADVSLLEHS